MNKHVLPIIASYRVSVDQQQELVLLQGFAPGMPNVESS